MISKSYPKLSKIKHDPHNFCLSFHTKPYYLLAFHSSFHQPFCGIASDVDIVD